MEKAAQLDQLSIEDLKKEYDEASAVYINLIGSYSFLEYHLFPEYRSVKIRLNNVAAELSRRSR